MKVFVTGASGWIGSALVPELVEAGHDVTGLARSDASAAVIEAAGARVLRGDLDDPAVLRKGAGGADGVIHLAFMHDVAWRQGDFLRAALADRRAVEVFAEALRGSNGPLLIASGVFGSPTERDGHDPAVTAGRGPLRARWETAEYTLSLASEGIRSCVVRLSPTCHGEGDHGFMATIVATARAKGVSGHVGDGSNHWPAVHRLDAAHLFRLALEKAPAGSTLHGVAEPAVAFRDVAEVIGRHLGVETRSIPVEDAAEHFGFLGSFVGADASSTSELTRELLEWTPTRPGLLADLDQGHYFQ